MRAYTKNGKTLKVWVGGLDLVATDGETGGTMRNLHAPADQQEYNLYEPLMQRVFKTLQGEMPEAVAGDRGYSVEKVFRSNTERGIASVFAFRSPHASIKRHDLRNLAFDEHGVGRCPHCNGPGAQIPGVSFRESGSPRIRFTCSDPNTVECLTASWSLYPGDYRQGWRLLVPLSRLSPRYHAMRETSFHFEKTFADRRQRYWAAGANQTGKLKRFGLGAHRLRSAASRFLEWFRICLRHGWIKDPTVKLNDRQPRLRNGEERRETMLNGRRWQGLDLPYGPKAYALKLALTPGIPPPRPSPKK